MFIRSDMYFQKDMNARVHVLKPYEMQKNFSFEVFD